MSNERPAPRRRTAGAVLGLVLLWSSAGFADGAFDGVWQGRMERDFGPLCARTYELHLAVEGELAAGRMLGPEGAVELLGTMTPDGRLVALRGKAALRFQLDGKVGGEVGAEVGDRVLRGTWSAIRRSLGDCSGSFVLRRRAEE